METNREALGCALSLLANRGLLEGKRVGVDVTTLKASAANRSIVRRETGESYKEFLIGLAKALGSETPTREQLAPGPDAEEAHVEQGFAEPDRQRNHRTGAAALCGAFPPHEPIARYQRRNTGDLAFPAHNPGTEYP